ncbi:SPOR domain-containing protein [Alloprevotella tannerae]|uniref:SPOR domain-containing protein n=1 Tax=Alloprevotella tannerae TaxID=76122 RepID=UPI00391F0023
MVLASSVNKKNAKAFIKQLRSDGFQEGKILSKPKMNRVVYGKYVTAQEAQKALTLYKKDNRFEKGWILQVPKLSNL